jgi:beta-1,4-mannosyl-glycoprotein beta-1,4-N-acetylglucosaminyltransferase
LSLRLRLLADVVDVFVVVEATRTFTGQPKVLNFSIDDYLEYKDKINYVVVDDMPGENVSPWLNEEYQRNAIMRGLIDAQPNDIVAISDVDEVINPGCFARYRSWMLAGNLDQKLYYYFLNNLVVQNDLTTPVRWRGAKITLFRHLTDFWHTPENFRRRKLGCRTLWNRIAYRLRSQIIENGGWHWSYIMSIEEISRKIKAFSHTEYSGENYSSVESVKRRLENNEDPFDRQMKMKPVDIDQEFPAVVAAQLRLHPRWLMSTSGAAR